MLNIRKILIGIDFSLGARRALEYGCMVAERHGAEVHLLHALVQNDGSSVSEKSTERAVSRSRRELATFATSQKGEITIREICIPGNSASRVILNYSRVENVDLIVIGSRGRSFFERMMLGSTADKVMRLSLAPVCLVPDSETSSHHGQIRRVLAPFDFSGRSEWALLHARELATTFGAHLSLLHVIDRPVMPSFYTENMEVIVRSMDRLHEAVDAELRDVLTSIGAAEVDSSVHISVGRAAQEIVEFARRDSTDLVVMATHGLTGILHFMVGSVAENVMRTAPCPLVLVKAYGKPLISPDVQLLAKESSMATTAEILRKSRHGNVPLPSERS